MKKVMISGICICILLLAGLAVQAEVYKWVDENGVVHYSDTPPPPQEESENVELYNKPEDPRKERCRKQKERETFDRKYRNKKKEIKQYPKARAELFVKPRCRGCDRARQFLEARGVGIIEYDVRYDKVAKKRHKRLDKHRRVPLAIINGRVVIRFDKKKYTDALEHGG